MATSKLNSRIVLTLSVEEAKYVRDALQNPVHGDLLKEPELDQECRSAVWSELNNCLEKVNGKV